MAKRKVRLRSGKISGWKVEILDVATALEVLQTRPCSKAGIYGGLKGGIWKACLNFNFEFPE